MNHETLTTLLYDTGTLPFSVAERLSRRIIRDPGMTTNELYVTLGDLLSSRYGSGPRRDPGLSISTSPVAFANIAIIATMYASQRTVLAEPGRRGHSVPPQATEIVKLTDADDEPDNEIC